MTGANCDLFTHKSSRSYLNHLVYECVLLCLSVLAVDFVLVCLPLSSV
jgi:hypothetical protein